MKHAISLRLSCIKTCLSLLLLVLNYARLSTWFLKTSLTRIFGDISDRGPS